MLQSWTSLALNNSSIEVLQRLFHGNTRGNHGRQADVYTCESFVRFCRPRLNEVSCPVHVPARRVLQSARDLPLPPSHAATTRLHLQLERSQNPKHGVEILFNIALLGVLGIRSMWTGQKAEFCRALRPDSVPEPPRSEVTFHNLRLL